MCKPWWGYSNCLFSSNIGTCVTGIYFSCYIQQQLLLRNVLKLFLLSISFCCFRQVNLPRGESNLICIWIFLKTETALMLDVTVLHTLSWEVCFEIKIPSLTMSKVQCCHKINSEVMPGILVRNYSSEDICKYCTCWRCSTTFSILVLSGSYSSLLHMFLLKSFKCYQILYDLTRCTGSHLTRSTNFLKVSKSVWHHLEKYLRRIKSERTYITYIL